ncbi:hypothetical protein HYI43_06795 [Staphylococcus taiwanensis]|nr:hypothetical protein HYI43_06795 [Staphylococcus taiwanensis]
MITKQDFLVIEEQLDNFSKNRALKSPEAKPLIDQYFDLIIQFFKQINDIDIINFNNLENYPVVPMNFEERYNYMIARKYHFMGYSQMKTLKTELIKMNASYQIRKNRRNK